MQNIKKLFLLTTLLFVLFATTGCITVKTTNQQAAANSVGGVFMSADKGTTWKSKSLIPTVTGQAKTFSGLDVAAMAMDPGDNKAVYFGSVGNGMYYTYNSGETWQVASGLGNSTVRAIAIDPKAKCNIFIAVANKIFNSQDCSRAFTQIYFDDPTVIVDALAIDHYDSSIIYAGISRGDLIKSEDAGSNWKTIYRVKEKIKKIVVNPNDSRIIGIATEKKGVYISRDNGENWTDFSKTLSAQKLGTNIKDIEFVKSEPDTIFLATADGMMRSKDKGETWDKIELIPPEKDAKINEIAVNQSNAEEIYYITNTTFYRSLDGGKNWKPFKLPTDRAGAKILLDPTNPNLIYLGVKTIAKK